MVLFGDAILSRALASKPSSRGEFRNPAFHGGLPKKNRPAPVLCGGKIYPGGGGIRRGSVRGAHHELIVVLQEERPFGRVEGRGDLLRLDREVLRGLRAKRGGAGDAGSGENSFARRLVTRKGRRWGGRAGARRGFDRGERGTRERGAHLGGAHVLLRLVFAHGERERHRPLGALTRATDRTRRRALGVCETRRSRRRRQGGRNCRRRA